MLPSEWLSIFSWMFQVALNFDVMLNSSSSLAQGSVQDEGKKTITRANIKVLDQTYSFFIVFSLKTLFMQIFCKDKKIF
jgi:hypothetical protein